mmetsp:Transcript_4572/g.11779  ORF Transcript_4572/g.11779 Transcript_4572/m.11779 type:complete len:262 (+) Transcript_4572:121-906(+)
MSRFGEISEAEKKAEAMRLKDAEILQRRKAKFDAARFEHIEKTNKLHGQPIQPPSPEQSDWRSESDAKKEEEKKKGWRIFKKKNKNSATELLKESTIVLPKPREPPQIAAKFEMPEHVPVEIAPNWAGVDQQNQRPHPNLGHSSDANFPRPPTAAKLPTHVPKEPRKPDDPNKSMYETIGYGTSDRKTGSNISSTIAAFQGGLKLKTGTPRQMKKQSVTSSSSETIDSRGNIIRTITKKITDPDGKIRTETDVIKILAKRQ